jgi:hypothetical protein
MISDNIYHQIHPLGVKSRRESNQVGLCPEVAVNGIDILGPIPMVRLSVGTVARQILYNR